MSTSADIARRLSQEQRASVLANAQAGQNLQQQQQEESLVINLSSGRQLKRRRISPTKAILGALLVGAISAATVYAAVKIWNHSRFVFSWKKNPKLDEESFTLYPADVFRKIFGNGGIIVIGGGSPLNTSEPETVVRIGRSVDTPMIYSPAMQSEDPSESSKMPFMYASRSYNTLSEKEVYNKAGFVPVPYDAPLSEYSDRLIGPPSMTPGYSTGAERGILASAIASATRTIANMTGAATTASPIKTAPSKSPLSNNANQPTAPGPKIAPMNAAPPVTPILNPRQAHQLNSLLSSLMSSPMTSGS